MYCLLDVKIDATLMFVHYDGYVKLELATS